MSSADRHNLRVRLVPCSGDTKSTAGSLVSPRRGLILSDEKPLSGRRHFPWRLVAIALSGLLVLALAGLVGLGIQFGSKSASLSETTRSLSKASEQISSLKVKVQSLESNIDELTQQVKDDQDSVHQAKQALGQVDQLKSQLAACQEAAKQYGVQAIANALVALNPNGPNAAQNLQIASSAQAAAKAAGCPGE